METVVKKIIKRRRTLKTIKDKSVRVRVTSEKYNKILNFCKEENISVSNFIDKAINDKFWEISGGEYK